MNLSVDFEKHRKFVQKISILIVSVIITLVSLPMVAAFYNIKMRFILSSLSVYQLLQNFFYTCQFALTALTLKERFKMINEYLERFEANFFLCSLILVMFYLNIFQRFSLRQKNVIVQVRQDSSTFNLKLFSELYHDLCDLIEDVNSTFTNQLIVVLMNLLLTDVFNIYGVLREVKSKAPSSSERLCFLMVFNVYWLSIQYAVQTFVVFCGETTTNEAERALVLVTNAYSNVESDVNLKNDLNSLLIQMKFRKKVFKNVFFRINFNLILTVSQF